MLRLASYDIVFQEIPDEVTLALNLSACPNRCPGCHSPHLQESVGAVLTKELLAGLLNTYGKAITCVCFMGGDATPEKIAELARFIRQDSSTFIKTGWYSGKQTLPDEYPIEVFNFIKLGPYIENLGGLDLLKTNQRLYRIDDNTLIDITHRFHKK